MNEQIQQMIYNLNEKVGVHWTNQDKLKFAELIVQECIRYFNEDYVRDFDTLWREDLSKGMKQHFGVLE